MRCTNIIDVAYADKHKEKLLKKYKGYYIAIAKRRVVGKGRDMISLYNNVSLKYHNCFLIRDCIHPEDFSENN